MIKIKDLSKNGVNLFKYSHELYKIKDVNTGKLYNFRMHDNANENYVLSDVMLFPNMDKFLK